VLVTYVGYRRGRQGTSPIKFPAWLGTRCLDLVGEFFFAKRQALIEGFDDPVDLVISNHQWGCEMNHVPHAR
jgi:hypothetical protein